MLSSRKTYFTPEIGTYPETLELVADAFDDHAEFGAILQEIFEMRPNRDDWLEQISELKDLVEQHMHKEEEKIFQLARTKLDEVGPSYSGGKFCS